MQMNDITQTVLEHADNPDLLGNKIKLRDESYQNCTKNIKNVPFQTTSIPTMEPVKSDYTILPSINGNALYSGSKPISVKENMFMGISSHAKFEQSSTSFMENPNVKEKVDISTVNPTVASSSIDVNNRFTEISGIRQLVQDAMVRADQAQQEAIQSEEALNKLSIEETEVQKKLEEAETRKKMIEEKIRKALSDQADTLETTRKKYEDLIVEANNKRDQSMMKIEDFKHRINSTNDKLSQVENEIANSQQILDALNQFEFTHDAASYSTTSSDINEHESEINRKVA